MSVMNTEYDAILSQVRRWPTDKRIALLEDVLHTLAPIAERKNARPKDTFSKALGLLRRSDTVPTDVQIDEMIAKRRLEKYG